MLIFITECPTPSKQKIKKESPPKPSPVQKDTPEKQTPVKNTANQRLSQLRARLSAEAQDESSNSNDKSPVKPKPKISPKPAPTETKTSKTENKSPTVTEPKCTTTQSQSPSSDSLQSIPSPSQFFAANKIISSMKAQLPEEYCDKTKPKDTFADIEHGICNEMSEYPYLKHPATPPQFSEASKLLSAIKSKLTKGACKEGSVKTYSSASERMTELRSSLSNELMDQESDPIVLSNSVSIESISTSEAMDVDCKEVCYILLFFFIVINCLTTTNKPMYNIRSQNILN